MKKPRWGGEEERFLEVLHHRPAVAGGAPALAGQAGPRGGRSSRARSWDPVRELGLVPLGQTPDEDARAPSRPLLGPVPNSDVSSPERREGTGGRVHGHTQEKGTFFFRATMVDLATLCKYVRRHFSKHVFMSPTVNAPFLKFYNLCYLMTQSTGCSAGSDSGPGESSREILTWAGRKTLTVGLRPSSPKSHPANNRCLC